VFVRHVQRIVSRWPVADTPAARQSSSYSDGREALALRGANSQPCSLQRRLAFGLLGRAEVAVIVVRSDRYVGFEGFFRIGMLTACERLHVTACLARR